MEFAANKGEGMNIERLEERLQIRFNNKFLLRQAFTHSSYVNEMRTRGKRLVDNERLEFLGDAVLELAVSEFLFRSYPQLSEGQMTKWRASIVCEPSLMEFATRLDFGSFILLGKGEEHTGGRKRPALLADVFEAFIGALYLDQGMEVTVDFLEKNVFAHLREGEGAAFIDFKTQLQEEIQRLNLGSLSYRIAEEKGPAHNREFLAEVWLNEQSLGQGRGHSKKEAEQKAASQALLQLEQLARRQPH